MNKKKFVPVALLFLSFITGTNSLVFAERECSRQVERSQGETTIATECTSSHTQTSEITRHPWFSVNNFLDNVNMAIQNFQEKLADMSSSNDNSKQIAADIRQREQEAVEGQRIKQQAQEAREQDFKEQIEMQKQRQRDFMQNLSYKK